MSYPDSSGLFKRVVYYLPLRTLARINIPLFVRELKGIIQAGHQCLMPVILATREAEIRRILV
jgi:hypothetical protein